jgi:glutathione synthase/RimK-type ligase-like ATP-grasp enzyme
MGYYCSLLAEARGHKVIPSIKTILELERRSLSQDDISFLEEGIKSELDSCPAGSDIELLAFFGQTQDVRFSKLVSKVFEQYRCPLFRVTLHFSSDWHIQKITPGSIKTIQDNEKDFFLTTLDLFTKRRWVAPKEKTVERYDLAILYNAKEQQPPSSFKTLEKFVRIGKEMGVYVELIQKKDFGRLFEFDALFIRETTAIDNHTFLFAQRAEKEGIEVIDDPRSIFRCANKVYLAELLKTHKINTPKTFIFDRWSRAQVEQQIAYPIILKVPDGSFSRGVFKVEDHTAFEEISMRMLQESQVILAQEYIYTPYDWRIGVLNGKVIFACQYFMSREHWKIVEYKEDGQYIEGNSKTLNVQDVPHHVIDAALRSTALIGNGLYGVDLKERNGDVFVIEINDNPNIDMGVEDAVLKDELYRMILTEFMRRLDLRWAK